MEWIDNQNWPVAKVASMHTRALQLPILILLSSVPMLVVHFVALSNFAEFLENGSRSVSSVMRFIKHEPNLH